jgi:energy-coupling factor transport system substrate-specific component
MVAIGWVGAGAGLIPKPSAWTWRIASLAIYGFFVAFAFGALMNLWFWPFGAGSASVGWAPDLGAADNLRRYATFYAATSFGWDAAGAVGNAVLAIVLGRPLLGALDRTARRMNLHMTPFEPEIMGLEPAG